MDIVQSKIDLIRKVLDEIESENRLTELFRQISVNKQRDFKDFSPENVCFDLIKYIIDQEELPMSVYGVNVYINGENKIERYELFSLAYDVSLPKSHINIVWTE